MKQVVDRLVFIFYNGYTNNILDWMLQQNELESLDASYIRYFITEITKFIDEDSSSDRDFNSQLTLLKEKAKMSAIK